MPSSFTPLLKLELPATGELSGTWGTTVNNAITTPLSEAVAGTTTITVGGSDYTLSNGDGSAANEARKMFIVATGTPGASRNVICPAASKFYVFRNDTNQTLTLKTLSGTGIAVPAGQYRFLYCDGTNVVETFNSMASLTLGTALGTASGGTGLNSFTANRVFYASSTSAIAQSANLTFNGTTLVANDFTDSSLTATRVTYAGAGGNLTDSANLTFDGTSLTLGGNPTLSAGTANGVLYLNGSKVATSGSALTFDGSRLSVGAGTALNVAGYNNIVLNGSTGGLLELKSNDTRVLQIQTDGASAGAQIATVNNGSNPPLIFGVNSTEQMRLTSTGLGIGTSSPLSKLTVQSQAASTVSVRTTDAVFGSVTGGTALDSLDASYSALTPFGIRGSTLSFGTSAGLSATLDSSGNLGLGVTPSGHLPAGYGGPMLQVGGRATMLGSATTAAYTNNTYYASGFFRYIGNDEATMLEQIDGQFRFYTAPSGTAGNAISFSQVMTLDASGNLGIGTSSPVAKLDVRTTSDGNVGYFRRVGGTINPGITVFANETGNTVGFDTVYSTSSPSYKFRVNGSDVMTLDASGNLGLGVTPSAWSTGKAFEVGALGNAVWGGAGYVDLMQNVAYTSGAYKYSTTAAAARYEMQIGTHAWFIAPSGTAGNAISFTQAMTLDASGRLSIGTISTTKILEVQGSVGYLATFRNNSSTATTSYINVINANNVNAGLVMAHIDDGTGYFGTQNNAALRFVTNDTERARITSGGYFKASNNGSYLNSTASYHETVSNVSNDRCLAVVNTNASLAATVAGIQITYTASSPNNTTNNFVYGEDSTAQRFGLRSNGGLANYQSNNVDLSDARTKKDITPAPSYWNKIGALEIVTYKYKDQTHDDINVGVIAQQVEQVEPVWVDAEGFGEVPEGEEPLKTVYTKDITFAAIKALQEAMFRIEALEAKVAALETH